MYTTKNFQTKKELKEAVKSGLFPITVFQPGLGEVPMDGEVTLEGPHYPQPHRWYARATLRGSCVVAVK